MPKILDYETFCENLEEVSSLKTIGKRKFHPEGLFSEQIFGPVKNYTCQCGTYYGISKSGGRCDTCKVEIENSDIRRTRFAKITLPMKVVNPLFYDLLVDLGGKSLKTALDNLMKQEKSVLYMDGDEHIVSLHPENIQQGTQIWEKTDAIEKLITDVAELMSSEGIEEWKLIKDNINNLFLNKIIVLPPDLRPTSKSSGNRQLMDKINRYYVQILTKKQIMRETTININLDKNMYYTYFKQLQTVVNELYDQILGKMAKKEGLIRGNILGKRIDFSGRAVICPEPTLSLDECVLPYLMILEMFKLPIARKIIQIGKFKLLNKAIDFIDKCISTQSPVLFRVCEDIVKDEVCILNRQPSLHRLGMLGFNIKISLDHVIKIHPLICPPFNADFDGDQMAVYIPVSEEAKQEIIEKMFVTKNLSSPANETLTTTPSQDIVLGIYFLTSGEFKGINGHEIFNSCLPDDYAHITGIVDKNKLFEILNDIKDRYPSEEVKNVLDKVKRTGFKYSSLYGCTLSLDDFNDQHLRPMRDLLYKTGSIRDQLVAVSSNKVIDEIRKEFAYSYMIESGARGSWDQVKQLIFSRGFISNFDGEILPIPIKHNLIEGLTQEEFFYSTFGCRKGLLDVALNTGTSGYLSRKLIFTCANLQIDLDMKDCGTTDTLTVNVKNARKAFMLVNRYALSDDNKTLYKITKENCRDLIGKKIEIRSPILCKNPKLCQTCYGDLYKTINSRFVGIIAAQTLGERATQLVLRTFHTSGSAVIKGETDSNNIEEALKQKDIIGDLATVASLLHKFKNKDYISITEELFDAYDADIYHVHFECVVTQLMWKNYKKWRLLNNRDKITPNYYSVQSVPNQESWILAMAFSNPKRSILHGILYEGRYSGVMDRILKGERIP
jgi:DNA-directed RNA polymerase subunit beta'